jgi:hypothetical protein
VLLDHEERDTAEVIAVKVRDRDRVDARGIEVLLDRGQRGAAAVEQERHTRCGHVDRGVGSAAVAERVPAPEEMDPNGHAISLRATGRRS